jgi:hypothetical protein
MSDLLAQERSILAALDADRHTELAGLLRILLAPFDAAGLNDTGSAPD